jgi:hypothetical protein
MKSGSEFEFELELELESQFEFEFELELQFEFEFESSVVWTYGEDDAGHGDDGESNFGEIHSDGGFSFFPSFC